MLGRCVAATMAAILNRKLHIDYKQLQVADIAFSFQTSSLLKALQHDLILLPRQNSLNCFTNISFALFSADHSIP